MNKIINWEVYSPIFTKAEFTCKCGCGLNNLTLPFINKLYIARVLANTPFVITSGCRCPAHNKKEGGTDTSDHLFGEGADIECLTSKNRFIIVKSLINAGFTRIGIAKTFIHVGSYNANVPEVMWLY